MSEPAEAKGGNFLGKGSRERHAEHVKAQVQVIRMRAQNQYAQDEGKMLAGVMHLPAHVPAHVETHELP